MRYLAKLTILIMLLFSFVIYAEQSEAMEIGGAFTLDLASNIDNIDEASFNMGTVELSANVNVAKDIIGSITLLAEENMELICIDGAFASYSSSNNAFSAFGGLHLFNYGLLETHLISDPTMLDFVETVGPGISVIYSSNNFSYGLGLVIFSSDDTLSPMAIHTGILNLDYSFSEEELFRLSTKLSKNSIDIDLGISKHVFGACFDIEAFSINKKNNNKTSGLSFGTSYPLKDNLELAFRVDGISSGLFNNLDTYLGLGFTFNITDEIFTAFEFGNSSEGNSIAIQFGLESSLKLPGFRRKTLTNN